MLQMDGFKCHLQGFFLGHALKFKRMLLSLVPEANMNPYFPLNILNGKSKPFSSVGKIWNIKQLLTSFQLEIAT